MTKQTEKLIATLMGEDETIPKSVGVRVMKMLSGDDDEISVGKDRILTRNEMADKLRVCPVTVTNWGKRGIIRAVRIKGRRKAVGYLESSAIDLMNGKLCAEVRA